MKAGNCVLGALHVLVGDHQVAAAVDLERQRQRRVGRAGERRRPVEPADELRLGHVVDVEDGEAGLPVAGVEPVAEPQRMVAAVRGLRPVRRLAAGGVLPRQPPAADLGRVGRVLEVHDHHDVADIALERRRQVGVAAVEIEPVHAGADRLPAMDLARLGRIAHVVDAEAGREIRRHRVGVGVVELVVDEHHVALHPHLVRMGAGRHADPGELLGVLRVAHVEDRGAVRAAHVPDIGDAVLHHDLPAAGAVHIAHLTKTHSRTHEQTLPSRHACPGEACPRLDPGWLPVRR